MYQAELSLSPEDREIEYVCAVLDEQLAALKKCRDGLRATRILWASWTCLEFARAKAAIDDTIAALEREVGEPDNYELYTTDEVSLAFAQEDLADAQAKLTSWDKRVQRSSDLAYDNYGSPAANKQLQRDIEAMDEWQDRVDALQRFIAAIPKDDIPY